MTNTTKTGQVRGPLGMHHHKIVPPALTDEQREVIAANRAKAAARKLGRPSITTQVDPFALVASEEEDFPF